MSLLIGMAGKAGSGKDTVGNYLKSVQQFEGVAFADAIRDGMRAMFGFTDKHFAHPHKEEVLEQYGKSPRQMMQTLGTEWGRQCVNENLWLIVAGEKVKKFHDSNTDVVITDVRFENEAKWVRENGGVIWHVFRPGLGEVAAHTSESGVMFYPTHDVIIDNSGTIHDLHAKVLDALVEAIEK